MEEKQTWWNWLAIASFVLALVWALLCLTIIWLPLWAICLILAFLFGFIALCKRQKVRAAILWMIISLWVIIWWYMVWKKFIAPVASFVDWIWDNPDLWDVMDNKDFLNKVKDDVTNKIKEKYTGLDDAKPIDVWSDFFEEAKMSIIELSTKNEESLTNISNPASEFCIEQGGELVPVQDEEWNHYAMCRLAGTELEEWEYFNAVADAASDVVEWIENEVKVCGDFYKTEEEINCNMIYAPVCWNDGNTYWNDCVACSTEWVDSYRDWECNAD